MKIFLLGLLILFTSSCKKEPISPINSYEINMSQLESNIDSPEQHRVIIQVEDYYILDTALNKNYYNFVYRFKTNDAVIFYLNSYPRKVFAYTYIYKNHQLIWEGKCNHKMTLKFK